MGTLLIVLDTVPISTAHGNTLRQKFHKSLERVRSSIFYKKLIEQMQWLSMI